MSLHVRLSFIQEPGESILKLTVFSEISIFFTSVHVHTSDGDAW